MKELIIGCGSSYDKRICTTENKKFVNPVRLDINPDHKPDVVWDLNQFPYPFEDNEFDEIHAYEVLEHCGTQGDYKFFFAQFSELWRILKPDGHLMATCPSKDSVWAWGDPSHTRVFQPEHLPFLSQDEYRNQIGKTPMSDFRNIYKADFKTCAYQDDGETFWFVVRAIK